MTTNIKKEFGNNRRKPDIESIVYGKIPPQATDLEAAVLGAILLERERLTEVQGIITTPDAFYKDNHQKIYAACMDLVSAGAVVDLLTVTEQLRKTGELEIVGGVHCLMELTINVVSSAHVEDHARIVMEKFLLREIIKVAGAMISQAYDGAADPFDLQQQFITDVNKSFEGLGATSWECIKTTAIGFSEQQANRRNMKVNPSTIKTTYAAIDEINEINTTDVIIIAARPSVGKSAFVLPMVIGEAQKGNAVGVINLEMSNTQTFGRMVSQISDIDHGDIQQGVNYSDATLTSFVSQLAGLPIFFSKSYTMKIEEITASAAWLKKKHNIKLLVIDYLQLINTGKSSNREQEVSKISRGLKLIAMSLDIAIIALSQLNRESEKRGNKRPILADLRESGALEQDANAVILLHRDWMVGTMENEDGSSTENEAHVIIAKWRNGRVGTEKIQFHGPTMKFSDKPVFTQAAPNEPFGKPNAGMPNRLPPNYFSD